MSCVIGGSEIKRGRGRRSFAREVVATAPYMCLPNNSLQLTSQVELRLVRCGSHASARLWHARDLGPGPCS